MTRKLYCHKRMALVLVALCVSALVQSAVLSVQRESHHSPVHCCLLCHIGPLPFLQANVSATPATVFKVVWLAAPAPVESTSDVRLIPSPSRAPPAV
jgi:hypothetical protein